MTKPSKKSTVVNHISQGRFVVSAALDGGALSAATVTIDGSTLVVLNASDTADLEACLEEALKA